MTYSKDREFADKHNTQIKAILEHLFSAKEYKSVEIATEYADINENTDFVVYLQKGNPIKIAARVRKFAKYSSDVPVRATTRNGNDKSEWQKIKEGYGDYMLYARQSSDGLKIDRYVFLDLDILREFTECSRDSPTKSSIIWNSDGSGFVPYSLNRMLEYDPRVLVNEWDGIYE